MNENTNTVSTADLVNSVVGFLLPPVVAIIVQPRWKDWQRALVTAGLCLIVGAVTAYARGDFSVNDVFRTFLVILVIAGSTFRTFWKPLNISGTIEQITSGGAVKPAEEPDTPHADQGGKSEDAGNGGG